METEDLITVDELCRYYTVEISFFTSLSDYGLVEVLQVNQMPCIRKSQLGELERLIRLHYDLDINMAGMDAIFHLLEKVKSLQTELTGLRNRLDQPDAERDHY
jgi:chaperone modulatory protein CbpM